MHASAAWYGGLEAITMTGLAGGVLACGRITTDAGRAWAVAAGAALMSLAMLGYGTAPAVLVLVPLSVLAGVGNGMVNVCVATLVMTRTEERMRGRVAAALGAVLNTASVGSLAAGGALAAVLAPRRRSTCWPAPWAAPSPPCWRHGCGTAGPAAPIFRSRLNGPAPSVSP